MKRQPYFPRLVSERPEWFANFADQLPDANTTLGIDPLVVADIVKDALDCGYGTGL